MSDIDRVKETIRGIFERRRAFAYALCVAYAGYAIRNFRARQPAGRGARGRYWVNRTGQAATRMFTGAFQSGSTVGWRMSHGVDYGVYLELANNRRNEAIRPTVEKFGQRMLKELRGYYGPGGA